MFDTVSQTSRLLILVALLISTSCAYRAGNIQRRIPGGYESIAIPMFKNLSHEVGVEVYFTNALIREIERTRLARVVSGKESQVTLEGVVDSVSYTAEGVSASGQTSGIDLPAGTVLASNYRIAVNMHLVLRRNSDQQVIWQSNFAGTTSYLAPRIGVPGLNSANSTYNHSAHHQYIAGMAIDMMAEANDRMTENF